MKHLVLALGLTVSLGASQCVEELAIDAFSETNQGRWFANSKFAQDAEHGWILDVVVPPNTQVAGYGLNIKDLFPKIAEWDELLFDYRVTMPCEWFGIKIIDKPLADGWQATWRLNLPANADKEWQTAVVKVHTPMWRWGDGPSDGRQIYFRAQNPGETTMRIRVTNFRLRRKNLFCTLDESLKWTGKKTELNIKFDSRLDHAVKVAVTPYPEDGVSFSQAEYVASVPARGETTVRIPVSLAESVKGMQPLTLKAKVEEVAEGRRNELDHLMINTVTPIPPYPSPMLFVTPEGFKQMQVRIDTMPGCKDAWNEIKQSADSWLSRKPKYPDRGAQWWHWYSCKKCGVSLKTKSATQHVCPVCNEVYSGWPYDDVVLSRTHDGLARDIQRLGLVYQLTKDPRYAEKAREIAMGYAERYLDYPLHDIHGKPSKGGGRVHPQTLDESIWLIMMVQGLDCIKDTLTQEDIDFLEEKMLLPAALMIKDHQWGIHNICCWQASAYGLVGFFLNRADLIHPAIFGPKGFIAQCEQGITDDGQWYERAWGYHFYTVNALKPLAIAIQNTGIVKLPDKLKAMYDAPIKFVTPTEQLPAFHDSGRVAFSFRGMSRDYENAYAWWKDPKHGFIVAQGKRNDQNTLLFGVTDLEMNRPDFQSENYADTGVVVMRSQSDKLKPKNIPSNYIALDYGEHGGGHGHPDKLNFVLYGHNQIIAEDPGCIAYGNPAHGGWYRQTLSHNTLVVNGKSQAPATGQCLAFAQSDNAAICVTEAGPIYPGVVAYRALAMIGDVILDAMWTAADSSRDFEYPFHARGILETNAKADATATPEGDGYQWATDWKILEKLPEYNFLWTQDNLKLASTLKMIGDDNEMRTAIGMGNPPTVKPPFILAKAKGKQALFAQAMAILTAKDKAEYPALAVNQKRNTIQLVAEFGSSTFQIDIAIQNQEASAKLVHQANGKLVNVLNAQ